MVDTSDDVFREQAPKVSLDHAREILAEHYSALVADPQTTVINLPSERDRNVLVHGSAGPVAVLKISSAAEEPAIVAMENAAMSHVARTDPSLPVPRLIPTASGSDTATVAGEDGRQHVARVVTVMPGDHLEGRSVSPELARDIGRSGARMSVALRGFFHPAAARSLVWDVREVGRLAGHASQIEDRARRELVLGVVDRVQPAIAATGRLRSAVQHGDVTLTNVLSDGTDVVTGVIDFGDLHHTAVVCDLVASMTSVLRSAAGSQLPDLVQLGGAFLEGYQRVQPLDVDEAELLGDLALGRLATTLLVSAWRLGEHPDNTEYIAQYNDASWLLLGQLAAVDPRELASVFMRLAGTSRITSRTKHDADLGRRRDSVLGGRLAPLTYRNPLEIVRGEGPWMFDADGRRYLDGYNNVPVVGHAHPTVVQAISRQAAVLNVSSRYLHGNVVELAERITATMPDPLDTCIFTNSGTEANDLAWRLATTYTSGSGAMIAEWCYHGISAAVVDFSSNEWPRGHRPPHVGTFRAPHADPGTPTPGHSDAHERVTRAAEDLVARGHPPALLLVDPMFTSEGILDATSGYLSGLVDATHDAGALFLADEVQAGFGRTGPLLWRFAALGVVPDIVTLGKPMGGGHPIAAVVTTRAIAEKFAARYEFFSTFAGNPVSCAASLAVLDVLEQQQLPALALGVGEHLRRRVRELGSPAVFAVRGTGLVAGVQLNGSGGMDARSYAREVVERLRDRGVLVGVTGPGGDVLKIRPPLVWTTEHADLFAERLGEVLA